MTSKHTAMTIINDQIVGGLFYGSKDNQFR